MESLGGIYAFVITFLLAFFSRLELCSSRSGGILGEKSRKCVLTGFVLLLGSMIVACSSSPSIRILAVSPGDGTVFVGAPAPQAATFTKRTHRSPARSLAVSPEDFSTATCQDLQYSAMATYTDGSVKDVTAAVNWTSSNSSAATINNLGQASGTALGITYIEASVKGQSSGGVPLYVDELNSITISPATSTLPVGSATTPSTLQFAATGMFTQANGTANSRDITSLVTWSSTNLGVATISASGLASSVTQGTTTIVATVCGVTSTTMLTVGPPAATSLQISPATPTIAVGSSLPFSALELYSDGSTHPLTASLQWSSSSKHSGVTPLTGVAFGVSTGTSTITATESGGNLLTGTATLTVQAAQAQFAYVANLQGNGGAGSISSFTVTAGSQTLTPLASTAATAPQQVLLEPSGNFLYSIDSASFVHVYQITTPSTASPAAPAGTLTLLDNASPSPYPPVLAGAGGKNVGAIDPSGQFLYVIDRTANTLYGFQIQLSQNGATPVGSLQAIPNGAPFTGSAFTLSDPTWVMTDRSGQFLYVVNAGNGSISGYTINFDGTLVPIFSSAPLPQTGNGPVYGTTDSKNHMYIANSVDNSVTAYIINSDGTWGSVGTLSVLGATAITNVLTDPAGQYLYALDQGGASGGLVSAYALIPPTAGSVFGTQIGQPQAVGSSPTGIAVDPSGVLLTVDNKGSDDISLFAIAKGSNNPPGVLTPAMPSTAPTEQSPQFLVFYNGLPIQ